jgi:hypothetical protein
MCALATLHGRRPKLGTNQINYFSRAFACQLRHKAQLLAHMHGGYVLNAFVYELIDMWAGSLPHMLPPNPMAVNHMHGGT